MSNQDKHAQWQAQAEQAERGNSKAGADPQIDQYRLILRALRRPVGPQLPRDFAAQLQRQVDLSERRAAFEDGLVTVLMLLMVAMGLVVAYPYLAPVVSEVRGSLPIAETVLGMADGALANVPWKAILGSALAIAGVMVVERFTQRSPLSLS